MLALARDFVIPVRVRDEEATSCVHESRLALRARVSAEFSFVVKCGSEHVEFILSSASLVALVHIAFASAPEKILLCSG